MTNTEAAEEIQKAIDLIRQDGKDWLDERDIPILEMAINALTKEAWKEEHPVSPLLQKPALAVQDEKHTQERTETHSCDCISRKAAIEWCLEGLNNMPSAQPEQPEWAQKVEEYRQNAPQHIHNPLAWALYQVWKEYDR